ncbi:MAG: hypothetical protein BHV68_16355 [Bacteroidales bacterium 43_8]|nr:MAG: hypothetical protein BHV68_16355 [Bacteroidales bacterium 43_8]
MSVQILTDSTSDILPEEAEQKGVRVVPLLVNFGEEAFPAGPGGEPADHQPAHPPGLPGPF